MLLSDSYKIYHQDKILMGYSSYTLKAYGVQIKLLLRYVGDVEINKVSLVMLKGYLSAQTHLKPSSLGHRVRFIRSFFRWALDEGMININPASKLSEPKLGDRIPKAMTEEEIELLRHACDIPYEHALLEFLYTTGCRIGEAHKVNISDINWEQRSLIVLGKGNKQREVYFTVSCALWLKKYLSSRKDECEALFVTQRRPYRRASIAQLRYVVKRIANNSELNINVFPHRLRHSYAMTLLEHDAPLESISSLMGHVSTSTTKLYANLSGAMRRKIYQKYF